MPFISVTPGVVGQAAIDLARIHSALADSALAAAAPTAGVMAAGQDEISITLATLFGDIGQRFQIVSAQARAFHAQFVSLMQSGVGAYAATKVANTVRVTAPRVFGAAHP